MQGRDTAVGVLMDRALCIRSGQSVRTILADRHTAGIEEDLY